MFVRCSVCDILFYYNQNDKKVMGYSITTVHAH